MGVMDSTGPDIIISVDQPVSSKHDDFVLIGSGQEDINMEREIFYYDGR